MPSRRQRQVAELLHQELSQLIQFEARDPRLGFVTVTDVEISPDLRQARVYFTVLGDEEDIQSTMAGLESAVDYFRRMLGQSVSLRYVPQLSFAYDASVERGRRVEGLLNEIRQEHDEAGDVED